MPPTTPPSLLDATVTVETPEQVTLTYTLAGFGSRALAALVDAIIMTTLLSLLVWGWVSLLSGTRIGGHITGTRQHKASIVFVLIVLMQFILLWGYYVIFEGVNDGQTPGKRLLSLRVVRDGGYAMTFATSAVRNLARIVDIQIPPFYIVGAISVLVTKSGKRLGDLLAGTFVVHEAKRSVRLAAPQSVSPSADGLLGDPLPNLPQPVLTDEEYDVVARYVERSGELTRERRDVLAEQIALRVQRHLPQIPLSPYTALFQLYKQERVARSSAVALRSDTGGRREQHAVVALGVGRWNEFATLLSSVRRDGLRRLTPEQVSDFVERYRELGADLARLQTVSRGRTFDALFFVSRLVASGHAVLYRERRHAMASAVRYMSVDVPREIRRSWCPIALAALVFFLPATIAYGVVVARPSIAPTFVNKIMLQRAAQGAERIRRHEGYVTIPPNERPIVASFIITNNVQIAYAAFAFGVTAGLGTLALLLFNGVSLGGGAGIFAAKGVAPLLLAFVAPHSVLELSAICISAGGGLLIASALVLPGATTRREALVARGTRAIRLVAAATLFLAVAGTIEGLISPRVWPLQWKLAVSAATALAMLAYIALGGADQMSERSLSSK